MGGEVSDADWTPAGVAGAGTGDVACIYWTNDYDGVINPWIAMRRTSGGPTSWTLTRPRQVDSAIAGTFGGLPHDIAAAPNGRIALVGSYNGITFGGGWVQVYDP